MTGDSTIASAMPYKLLDLFSGIGGFSLGLERTGGFQTVAFCEIEPFPRRVLAKHWPEVPCYHDIRELTADRLSADGIAVDAICGGFPCQDLSVAGAGAGLHGMRSGLWYEYARLIGELRPRYVIVENVAALLGRGIGDVLGSMAALGYDAEWHCIPASAVGAPHRRDRLWIVAYPCRDGHRADDAAGVNPGTAGSSEGEGYQWQRLRTILGRSGTTLADSESPRLEGRLFSRDVRSTIARLGESGRAIEGSWRAEPDVGRVAHGVPDRAHRLRGLGNAVVPQIPELIGHAILASERRAS